MNSEIIYLKFKVKLNIYLNSERIITISYHIVELLTKNFEKN